MMLFGAGNPRGATNWIERTIFCFAGVGLPAERWMSSSYVLVTWTKRRSIIKVDVKVQTSSHSQNLFPGARSH
jgi:hypothetical protein